MSEPALGEAALEGAALEEAVLEEAALEEAALEEAALEAAMMAAMMEAMDAAMLSGDDGVRKGRGGREKTARERRRETRSAIRPKKQSKVDTHMGLIKFDGNSHDQSLMCIGNLQYQPPFQYDLPRYLCNQLTLTEASVSFFSKLPRMPALGVSAETSRAFF